MRLTCDVWKQTIKDYITKFIMLYDAISKRTKIQEKGIFSQPPLFPVMCQMMFFYGNVPWKATK